MAVTNKIRQFVQEQLLIEEAKDHLIRKIPSLTTDQKDQLIDLYKNDDNLERLKDEDGKPLIDWTKLNHLTWEDFQPIINHEYKSISNLRKKVKNEGIKGLKIGTDYVPVKHIEDIDGLQGAYIPLNYEASKMIASKSIGDCVGEWCTAAQKTSKDWNKYIHTMGIVLIYCVFNDTKYAIAVYPGNTVREIFDAVNDPVIDIPGLDVDELIHDNTRQIDEVREHFLSEDNTPIDIIGGFGGVKHIKNADGSVDVFGDVRLTGQNLTEFPVKFRKVDGNFDISNNRFDSLVGSPIEVTGDFVCSDNPTLKHLKGAPKKVKGSFKCSFTGLNDLIGGPVTVEGDYDCSRCGLDSLVGSPMEVGGTFRAAGNELTSLNGGPKSVGLNFFVQQNRLVSLAGAPANVGGKFTCTRNNTLFTEDDVIQVSKVKGEIVV